MYTRIVWSNGHINCGYCSYNCSAIPPQVVGPMSRFSLLMQRCFPLVESVQQVKLLMPLLPLMSSTSVLKSLMCGVGVETTMILMFCWDLVPLWWSLDLYQEGTHPLLAQIWDMSPTSQLSTPCHPMQMTSLSTAPMWQDHPRSLWVTVVLLSDSSPGFLSRIVHYQRLGWNLVTRLINIKL